MSAAGMPALEFGAVPQELVDMSEELEALGGGDARLAPVEVYCRARPAGDGVAAESSSRASTAASRCGACDPDARAARGPPGRVAD